MTEPLLQPDRGQPAHTITLIAADAFDAWLAQQPPSVRAVAAAQRFAGKRRQPRRSFPMATAGDWSVAAGRDEPERRPGRSPGSPRRCREGCYRLARRAGPPTLGWLLAQYRFDRYRKAEGSGVRASCCTRDVAAIERRCALAAATALVRDMVNTGASDMGPAELEAAAQTLAKRQGAALTVTRGDALATGYPMIHAVGQAAVTGARAAPDRARMGQPRASAHRDRRQGRLLRHRRARHQAVVGHAADEEGHGRRRARAGAGASWSWRRSCRSGSTC